VAVQALMQPADPARLEAGSSADVANASTVASLGALFPRWKSYTVLAHACWKRIENEAWQ